MCGWLIISNREFDQILAHMKKAHKIENLKWHLNSCYLEFQCPGPYSSPILFLLHKNSLTFFVLFFDAFALYLLHTRKDVSDSDPSVVYFPQPFSSQWERRWYTWIYWESVKNSVVQLAVAITTSLIISLEMRVPSIESKDMTSWKSFGVILYVSWTHFPYGEPIYFALTCANCQNLQKNA